MKFNLTEEQIQINIIKESLIERFGKSELNNFNGQPSRELSFALTNLAEKFGDTVTLKAFNEAATMSFTGKDKAEIKTAVDQGGSPDAIEALVREKAAKKDPSNKAALAKLGMVET